MQKGNGGIFFQYQMDISFEFVGTRKNRGVATIETTEVLSCLGKNIQQSRLSIWASLSVDTLS